MELALSAIGIVLLAYLTVRVGQWVNESLVERNRDFQRSRLAAGQTGSLTRFAAPKAIHLIGGRAELTPGAGEQPLGPSAMPVGCSGDGANAYREADRMRSDITRLESEAQAWRDQVERDSEKAKALTLNYRGSNWYWLKAQELRNIFIQIWYWTGEVEARRLRLEAARRALADFSCDCEGK